MNNEEIKNRIVEIVTETKGCKIAELCSRATARTKELIFGDCKPILELIDELIKEERILEIEYIVPGYSLSSATKSFLVPVGTKIKISKGESESEKTTSGMSEDEKKTWNKGLLVSGPKRSLGTIEVDASHWDG